ncbi:MAG TPA: lysophospholipid acyltransferase family protein [Blastocatellia bacterium]|nr:lysophospholipid acyltransferase family protein [Blastocatellia bacterium]
MRIVTEILRPFVWLFCRIFFRIRFAGVENVPSNGSCLITPNHSTFADPIWITIPLHRMVHYMAWDRPFQIPVLGLLMRIFGAFPVKLESADASAQREAIELLKRGKALVIFPEGGRTKTGELMPFKMGAFRLATTLGIPVVPVAIEGGHEIWPPGQLLPRPGRLKITYLPAIRIQPFGEASKNAELKQHVRVLAGKTRDEIGRILTGLDIAARPSENTSGD